MKEFIIKSIELATDLTKQLITLSTILIGLSITFIDKIHGELIIALLIISWIVLLLSILSGIFTLMSFTGAIGKLSKEESEEFNIYDKNITIFSKAQVFLFSIGILFMLLFGITSKWV